MKAEQEKMIALIYSDYFQELQEAHKNLTIAIEDMQRGGIKYAKFLMPFVKNTKLESWKKKFQPRCKAFFEEQIILDVTNIHFVKNVRYIDTFKRQLQTWLDFIKNPTKIDSLDFELLYEVKLEKEFWILVYEDMKAFKPILEQELKALHQKNAL